VEILELSFPLQMISSFLLSCWKGSRLALASTKARGESRKGNLVIRAWLGGRHALPELTCSSYEIARRSIRTSRCTAAIYIQIWK
jgi:hypothetical protein